MDVLIFLFSLMPLLVGLILVGLLGYFIMKRMEDKKNENFEDRNN